MGNEKVQAAYAETCKTIPILLRRNHITPATHCLYSDASSSRKMGGTGDLLELERIYITRESIAEFLVVRGRTVYTTNCFDIITLPLIGIQILCFSHHEAYWSNHAL